MATSPNYGWLEPDNTDLVKNGALAIRTLGNAIDTTMATMTPKSIVDAKGDLIAASANDTPARLAVGNNGETLVADSSASTGLRYQGNFAAGKNKFINGDFGIWQRGTTFTPQTSGTYNADRWVQVFDVAPTTGSITRETFTPGTAPVAGYEGQYFHRTTITTRGSSTYYILGQRIEDVRTFAGQTITVSFWAKLNAGSVSTSRIRVSQDFGSGGSGTVTTDNSYNFTPTGSWTRFSLTIPVPSISGKTIGTGNNLIVDAVVPYSAANTVDFWGWQVEAGSVATAFQTATGTIQGELSACQRYYFRQTGPNLYTTYGQGGCNTTTDCLIQVHHPVIMRVTPTSFELGNLELSDYVGTAYAFTTPSIFGTISSPYITMMYFQGLTGVTANRLMYLRNANNANGYLGLSAEL